jgi:hypothetical protein
MEIEQTPVEGVSMEQLQAAQARWAHEVAQRVTSARAATTDTDFIEKCESALIAVGSVNRLPLLLRLVTFRPARLFWPVFLDHWSVCDATWPWRSDLLIYLRRHHADEPGPGYLQADDLSLYNSLPDQIEVFRGCSRSRVRGISWTVDRSVAEGFARGHRYIRVPEPVVARAVIPKLTIFAALAERNEGEILLDPRRLRRLSTADLEGAA